MTLAFAWVAYPFTQYVSSSNTNDALPPLFLIWGFWLVSSPVARGAFTALSGWTKFAPLLLAPLWASYPERRLRPTLVFVAAFLAREPRGVLDPAARATRSTPRTSSGTARSPGRSTADSPFSIWDWRQYHAGLPDLHILQRVLEGALLVGAVAVYFVPRRKSPLQLAALTAALLLGFELVLTHWFYLYMPWFFPFVAFAVLAPGGRAAAVPPSERHLSVLAKSWSASTEPRRLLVGAAGLFLVSMTLLHWGWYQHDLILDTVEYHRYGAAIADGHVPYRDFAVEYPPGALPAFGIPAIGKPSFAVLQPRVPDPDGALRGRLAGGDVRWRCASSAPRPSGRRPRSASSRWRRSRSAR